MNGMYAQKNVWNRLYSELAKYIHIFMLIFIMTSKFRKKLIKKKKKKTKNTAWTAQRCTVRCKDVQMYVSLAEVFWKILFNFRDFHISWIPELALLLHRLSYNSVFNKLWQWIYSTSLIKLSCWRSGETSTGLFLTQLIDLQTFAHGFQTCTVEICTF